MADGSTVGDYGWKMRRIYFAIKWRARRLYNTAVQGFARLLLRVAYHERRLIQPIKIEDGTTVLAYAANIGVTKRIGRLLTKEPATIAWIDTFGPDDVFWDIGANVGVYTIYAARKCRVVAFEPQAANYLALCRHIDLNAISDKATALCIAVARETKIGSLSMEATRFGASEVTFDGAAGASRQGAVAMSLDDLAGLLAPPTHIKVDVDGLELDILKGGQELLSKPTVRSVMAESDQDRLAETVLTMAAYGFRLASEGRPGTFNALFVRD